MPYVPPKKPVEMPEWMNTFRRNLRATRRRLKVSQEELAERTGQFATGISQIERGQRPGITYETARLLAEGLGVTVDDLMGRPGTAKAVDQPKPRPGNAKRIPHERVQERPPDSQPFGQAHPMAFGTDG